MIKSLINFKDIAFFFKYLLPMTIPLLGVDANENWNQFRGPNGSGNANENFTPPIHISNDNIAWKTNIPERFIFSCYL